MEPITDASVIRHVHRTLLLKHVDFQTSSSIKSVLVVMTMSADHEVIMAIVTWHIRQLSFMCCCSSQVPTKYDRLQQAARRIGLTGLTSFSRSWH